MLKPGGKENLGSAQRPSKLRPVLPNWSKRGHMAFGARNSATEAIDTVLKRPGIEAARSDAGGLEAVRATRRDRDTCRSAWGGRSRRRSRYADAHLIAAILARELHRPCRQVERYKSPAAVPSTSIYDGLSKSSTISYGHAGRRRRCCAMLGACSQTGAAESDIVGGLGRRIWNHLNQRAPEAAAQRKRRACSAINDSAS